jgi:hypothetical protein
MADNVNVINVTSLTPIVAAAIVTGQQVTIYDQGGIAYRAPIEDMVSAAQLLNNCACIHTHSQVITSAEILASNTTPILLVSAPPAGYVYDIISAFASTDGNYVAPPYAGSTVLEIIEDGATVAAFTSDFLESTINRIVKFTPNAVSVASNSNMISGDILLKNFATDPTTGTYDIKVYIAYRVVEL